ncbi:MAG TPA: hypothetical protein VE135_05890 [Pyrinomonadaceae bacterium]|nr:hypothetical protein [Pyrinomonadaceae bacterium]
MFEGLLTVDRNHRNIIAVATEEVRVGFNVYDLKIEGCCAVCGLNRFFGFITQMTVWPGIDRDVRLQHVVSPIEQSKQKVVG